MNRLFDAAVCALLVGGMLAVAPSHTTAATAADFGAATLYPEGGGIADGSLAAMPAAGSTKVFLYAEHLMPMQIYRPSLSSGRCAAPGGVVYTLPDTQADADGSIHVDTMINATHIPPQGLAVTVQPAKTGSPVVACGTAHPVDTVLALRPLKISTVPTAMGYVLITRTTGNRDMLSSPMTSGTEVVVYVNRFEPSTVHEEHIHAGACSADLAGQVRFPLTDIETDATGQGVASTFIDGTPNFFGSYINVHAADLRPASCANFG